MRASNSNIFVIGACALVALGIGLAFSQMGSPAQGRQIALDQKRIRDLNAIAWNLQYRYTRVGRQLPKQLPNYFGVGPDGDPILNDPVTGRRYIYFRKDAKHYRLCARFGLASDQNKLQEGDHRRLNWPHSVGQTCYSFDASADSPEPMPVKP